MTKHDVPDYPLALAVLDALPVALFFASGLVVSLRLKIPLFLAGAVISFAAGAMQFLWKLLICVARKNVWFLHAQFKYAMAAGLVLMVAALILSRANVDWHRAARTLVHFPALIFLVVMVLCFAAMVFLSLTLGIKDVRSQWIEESVNVVFQASVLACVLLAVQ